MCGLACTLQAVSAKPHQPASTLADTVLIWLPSQELVDLHVFAGARKVVADLRQHDCTAALAWCEEHKGRLKKGKNKLEFKLRMQVRMFKMTMSFQSLGACCACQSYHRQVFAD